MKNIIAVGGEPATGKTTLMWRIIDSVTDWQKIEPKKTLSAIRSESLDLTILGKYDRGLEFAGTDRLSMSVQPAATEFIKEATGNILFEGDRLFNRKFIGRMHYLHDVYKMRDQFDNCYHQPVDYLPNEN